MTDQVRDGRQLMQQDEPLIWRTLWEMACELSRPRMPEHYFDADGRLHVTVPRRYQANQRTGEPCARHYEVPANQRLCTTRTIQIITDELHRWGHRTREQELVRRMDQ